MWSAAPREVWPAVVDTPNRARCMCSLYDLVVQQGGLQKALPEITLRVKNDKPVNQFELVRIAVQERGRKARDAVVNHQNRGMCLSQTSVKTRYNPGTDVKK